MNLYELTKDIREVEARLDAATEAKANGEEGAEEMAQMWKDTLESLQGSVEHKLLALAKLSREKRLTAEAIKAERQRLEKKQRAAENAESWIRNYMAWAMTEHQITKAGDTTISATYSQGRPKVEVKDLEALKATPFWKPYKYDELNLDRTAIKERLESGEEIPGAELVTERVLTIR